MELSVTCTEEVTDLQPNPRHHYRHLLIYQGDGRAASD